MDENNPVINRIKSVVGEFDLNGETYTDLRRIPVEVLDQVREVHEILGGVYAMLFLRLLVDFEQDQFLPAFISDVIAGNEKASTWRCKVIAYCDFSVEQLVVLGFKEICSLLAGSAEQNIYKIPSDLEIWKSNPTMCGSLVCKLDDHDYRYVPPRGISHGLEDYDLNPVEDVKLEYRKFLAARVFFAVNTSIKEGKAPLDCLRSSFPLIPDSKFSLDAIMAVNGLIFEENSKKRSNRVPGQCAPDSVFLEK